MIDLIIPLGLLASLVIGLGIAMYTDLKDRIISNGLVLTMVSLALALRVIHGLITGEWTAVGVMFILMIASFVLGMILYQTGQWAAGDMKLMVAVSAYLSGEVYLSYVALVFVVGTIYGLIWQAYHAKKNWGAFTDELLDILAKPAVLSVLLIIIGAMVASSVLPWLFGVSWITHAIILGLVAIVAVAVAVVLFSKAVERSCGKEGVPFAPVFLLSFIALVGILMAGWV